MRDFSKSITNTIANSWFTQNRVSFAKSLGLCACGSTRRSWRLSFGKAHKDHKVRLSSGSGSSVANRKFSYDIFSNGRWFQANKTAIWNVVTSTSKRPTWLENVIWNTIQIGCKVKLKIRTEILNFLKNFTLYPCLLLQKNLCYSALINIYIVSDRNCINTFMIMAKKFPF